MIVSLLLDVFKTVAFLGLVLFGAHRIHLILLYLRHRGEAQESPLPFDTLPRVTVQLPIYNEKFVVDRLIDSVCRLDYPGNRLEIQVLDDSTDETREQARAAVERHRDAGFDISHIRRAERTGFKAGALQEGLRQATGEFVAIFDADFVPPRAFLRGTIHHFTDPRVGMVQARWGHLNRSHSLLTRVQAIFLDAHFLIEHVARSRSGRFFNFNGTAGIWRRACLLDAGGWEHDTLTEDLDISYRAQMRGWRFVYRPDLVAPAELPPDPPAFKAQQHRWAKGSIQTARKLLPRIWRAPLPLRVKLEATLHLTNNLAFLLLLGLLISIPATLVVDPGWGVSQGLLGLPFFFLATGPVSLFYIVSQRGAGAGWLRSITSVPLVLCLGMGMSLNAARAVLEALLGISSEFVRTPKNGDGDREIGDRYLFVSPMNSAAGDSHFNIAPMNLAARRGYSTGRSLLPYFEIALGLAFLPLMGFALYVHAYGGVLFPALASAGLLLLGIPHYWGQSLLRKSSREVAGMS